MKLIQNDEIRRTVREGSLARPEAIATRCPHCAERVIFTCGNALSDNARAATAVSAECPACHKKASFWTVPIADGSFAVYMHPDGDAQFDRPVVDVKLPDPLLRAWVSTIDAFNSTNYAATAVCGRRTLEGIFKYLVPEDRRRGSLAELIQRAKTEVDLAAPLTALSHAIRSGGNLGAHFDMEREPDRDLARQIVELLSYLISYLYVLPTQIQALEKTLNGDPDED